MNRLDSIRNELETLLDAHSEIDCCYLFGSAAGSRFTTTSDIDLGIAADRVLSSESKGRLKEELEHALQRDVDLVDLRQATGGILRRALRGVCIRCRNTQVRYQLMRRLVYDQEDFHPARDRIMQRRRRIFAYGH